MVQLCSRGELVDGTRLGTVYTLLEQLEHHLYMNLCSRQASISWLEHDSMYSVPVLKVSAENNALTSVLCSRACSSQATAAVDEKERSMRKISNIEWSKATKWQRAVQKAFPKNAGEEGISGDGPWAVLMCDYWHPSARCHCYGNIYLSESREKREEITTAHAIRNGSNSAIAMAA